MGGVGMHAEPAAYWEARARRFAGDGAGLAAVCSYGMPRFYNRYIHLTQSLALRPWLRVRPGTRVLDAGCGVGRWSRRLAHAGAEVTGVDLAPTMVNEARRRAARDGIAARCRFLTADLVELDLGARFERILGVTVLQHIVDADRFERAVGRLAAHLSPEGRLMLLEVAPTKPVASRDGRMFCAREEGVYRAAFARAGLVCVAVRGVDPAPFKVRFLPWYRHLPPVLATMGLAAVTGASLPVDVLLGRWWTRASWHKLFVLTPEPVARSAQTGRS
jgi:2-polyprenyl-3-methyl-5-hydroxy-6-metoxy-1,4-benzoquinol methylase